MGKEALRDHSIAEDVYEVLRDHRLLSDSESRIEVRGGVAHVSGRARSDSERRLLRKVIGRVRGIHAVWDTLTAPGEDGLRILDIGCGNQKQQDFAVGVDCHSHPSVDVIAQVERGLPMADDSVDQVYTIHFLEHVRDLLGVMNEIHRVLKPGGVLHVMVPNWQFVNAVADPTHVRFFSLETFKFFCRPYPGMRQYRPLLASSTTADLFADLQPVKGQEEAPSEELLCRFFN